MSTISGSDTEPPPLSQRLYGIKKELQGAVLGGRCVCNGKHDIADS